MSAFARDQTRYPDDPWHIYDDRYGDNDPDYDYDGWPALCGIFVDDGEHFDGTDPGDVVCADCTTVLNERMQ